MITLAVYDFDGVMTDNKVYTGPGGAEFVCCNRNDGWGVRLIRRLGVRQLILTAETDAAVQYRAKKLNLDILPGVLDKAKALTEYSMESKYDLADVLYVGDGLNDVEVMRIVGHPIAVFDAEPACRDASIFLTDKKGGEGVLLDVYKYIQGVNGYSFCH